MLISLTSLRRWADRSTRTGSGAHRKPTRPRNQRARLACQLLEPREVPALVDPVFVDGNPDCSDLFPGDSTLREFRVEPVADGTYTSGDGLLTVTIDVIDTAEGPTFNWTANIGLDTVIVKGGDNVNWYNYRPLGTEPTADGNSNTSPTGDPDGLHAPVNPANGTYFGLSHISFCYDLLAGIRLDKVTNGADGLDIPAGTPVTWTYTVTNPGVVPLSGVTVTDDRGVVPVYQSGDADNDGLLDPTETWVYTATGTAEAGAYGNVGTAAGVFDGETVSDSDPSSYFGSAPGISIVKTGTFTDDDGDGLAEPTDGNGLADPGELITFTFAVTNTGNVTLNDVTVTDAVSGVTVTGGPTTLDVGETDLTTFTGVYAIIQADINAGHFFNTATATGFAPTQTQLTADGSTDVTLDGLKQVDLRVRKASSAAAVRAGGILRYVIRVTNLGDVTVNSFRLTELFPPGFTPLTFRTSTGTYDRATREWTGLTLAPGQTVVLRITGRVALSATGSLVNQVRVDPPDGLVDINPANNRATRVVKVLPPSKRWLLASTYQ